MPKKELQAVLIKQQHNVASNGIDYPLRLPRIMHDYVVLWQKRRSAAVSAAGKISRLACSAARQPVVTRQPVERLANGSRLVGRRQETAGHRIGPPGYTAREE